MGKSENMALLSARRLGRRVYVHGNEREEVGDASRSLGVHHRFWLAIVEGLNIQRSASAAG